jgi:two-component system LytT family response regulator
MITTPIRCFIIDDEPRASANLEALLKDHPEIRILGILHDSSIAVDAILREKPDLLFLDIQMPGKSGFEIASELLESDIFPSIIFVTAFDRFAIEAIRHAAFDFLVKPVNPEELNQAIRRFHDSAPKSSPVDQLTRLIERTLARPKLKISTAGGFTLIDPAEIVYIQADWNYSEIFLGKEKCELATLNIGAIEEALPKTNFYRINRSVIINVNYLTKVSRKKREATLIKDGQEFNFPIPLLNIRKLERFLE